MARFYAEVTGSRGTTVTKTGDKNTGIRAHIRGWKKGVYVEIESDGNEDIIRIYTTGGSNDPQRFLIKQF